MDYRDFGKKVWSSKTLQINEWQFGYLLISSQTGLILNELISGPEGLKKYHKNSFKVYVRKILNKNLKARKKEREYFKKQMEKQEDEMDYMQHLIDTELGG